MEVMAWQKYGKIALNLMPIHNWMLLQRFLYLEVYFNK